MYIIVELVNRLQCYSQPEKILSFDGKNVFLNKETALEKMWQRFERHVFGWDGFTTDFMEDGSFRLLRMLYDDSDDVRIEIYDSIDNIAYRLKLIKLQVNME